MTNEEKVEQITQAFKASGREPFNREKWLERLDSSLPDWSSGCWLPRMTDESLIELAQYFETVADDLADSHEFDTLHLIFSGLDNVAGDKSGFASRGSIAAIIALLSAVELLNEQGDTVTVMNFQNVAAECLRVEALAMRELAGKQGGVGGRTMSYDPDAE